MEHESLRIGKKVFITSVGILFALMIFAGILTLLVTPGYYQRETVDGLLKIIPGSYSVTDSITYPIWRWFTAPVEVLTADGSLILIVICMFLLIVGGSISVLNGAGVIQVFVDRSIEKYKNRKFRLMYVLTFIFMAFGAFVGIFEELIPLVPIVMVLSVRLGWDRLTGLGMSLLAAGFGFSAAVSNPFTIGVAQELAELPMFSGALFRLVVFALYYGLLIVFLRWHISRIDKETTAAQDALAESKFEHGHDNTHLMHYTDSSMKAFFVMIGAIVILLVLTGIVSGISDYALPLVALILLMGGLSSGLVSNMSATDVLRRFFDGISGVAPAIILILMASSIKHIIEQGGILDTILNEANEWISGRSDLIAVLMVFFLVLALNFFIGSGSAKAFLLMPIIVPMADLIGVNRQIMVLAFQFGDGFSNILYPTNPVLLIALGLTAVSYQKWFRFTIGIQLISIVLNCILLGIALLIGYGPY